MNKKKLKIKMRIHISWTLKKKKLFNKLLVVGLIFLDMPIILRASSESSTLPDCGYITKEPTCDI